MGTIEDLETLIPALRTEQIIVAIPGANAFEMRRIFDICASKNVEIKTLPAISDLIDGRVLMHQIRDIDVKDLLGRRTVEIDISQLSRMLRDKRILVTGASGSIGSELCRQISHFGPSQLIMFDISESSLFFLEEEIKKSGSKSKSVLGDIRDKDHVRSVFSQFSPEVVFHAAAYKHVPMMEENPIAAVSVNVAGSKILADLAAEFEVTSFVMVSTDKAVNPANVL